MKVGIIGCGKISQVRHIPEYAQNANSEIVGYYDFNIDRAEKLAAEYGGKAYSSLEELLEDETIEAVSVCAANNAHAKISIEALNKGKHVLCEKPMAISLEECIQMVNAAEKNGKKLMIGQNQRFAKAHRKAKKLLKEGIIGDVITFKTTFGHRGPENWSVDGGSNTWFFDKKKSALGVMADLGVHKTDLIQFLLDQRIVETSAVVSTLDKKDDGGNLIEVDDNAVCIYKTEEGVIGTMSVSWTYYGEEENSTVLYGTDGIMKIYGDLGYSIVVTTKDGEKILYDVDQIQTNDNQTKSGIIDAFVNAVMEDKEPEASGKDVLHTMKVIFSSIESSSQGQKILIS